MTALTALAEFVQSRELASLPAARFDLLKRHLADTLGALEIGSKGCSDLVSACAAIRSTEVDDIHLSSCTTPGSVIFPAAIALAGSTCGEFFAAVAAGYELIIRLGRAIDGPNILRKRVWPTYFAAAVGSAATASRAYGLNVEQTAGALSTALTLSTGTSSPAHSSTASRWLTLGAATANGVLAAEGAQRGLVGPDDLIERYLGRIAGVRISRKRLLQDLGRTYFLDEIGMKPYPTARQALSAVEACRELVAAESITVPAIQGIVVGIPEAQRWVIDHPKPPETRFASIVSVQYQIALALVESAKLVDVVRSDVFMNPSVESLMAKIRVVRAPELEKHYPATWPARVTIKTEGRRRHHTLLHPRGDANNALSWDDIAKKYRRSKVVSQIKNLRPEDNLPKLWEVSH